MSEPITAAEAAVFLRLDGASDSPTPEEDFLNGLILAARLAAENYLNRTITVRQRTLILDAFPPFVIPLPDGDVISVDTIAYVDTDGADQTVSSFILSEDRLTPAFGETWPPTQAQIGAVTITYTAGYADINSPPENGTPENIVQSMYLIIGDMYENREAGAQGSVYQINPAQKALLDPDRIDMGV